jgi:hypothetical protein
MALKVAMLDSLEAGFSLSENASSLEFKEHGYMELLNAVVKMKDTCASIGRDARA